MSVSRFLPPTPPATPNERALAQQMAETITGAEVGAVATVTLSNVPVPPIAVEWNGRVLPEASVVLVGRVLTLPRPLAASDVLVVRSHFRAQ